MNIVNELDKYHIKVKKHYNEFLETQGIWQKICNYASVSRGLSRGQVFVTIM